MSTERRTQTRLHGPDRLISPLTCKQTNSASTNSALHRESWFLGQCARLAATAGLRGLVMFSDLVQRRSADGTVVMPGHVGVIYQATNAVYTN